MDGRIGLTGVLLYRVKIPMLKLSLVTEKSPVVWLSEPFTVFNFVFYMPIRKNYKRSVL